MACRVERVRSPILITTPNSTHPVVLCQFIITSWLLRLHSAECRDFLGSCIDSGGGYGGREADVKHYWQLWFPPAGHIMFIPVSKSPAKMNTDLSSVNIVRRLECFRILFNWLWLSTCLPNFVATRTIQFKVPISCWPCNPYLIDLLCKQPVSIYPLSKVRPELCNELAQSQHFWCPDLVSWNCACHHRYSKSGRHNFKLKLKDIHNPFEYWP